MSFPEHELTPGVIWNYENLATHRPSINYAQSAYYEDYEKDKKLGYFLTQNNRGKEKNTFVLTKRTSSLSNLTTSSIFVNVVKFGIIVNNQRAFALRASWQKCKLEH